MAMELDLMFLKKTPPHSLEAERTVLVGILVQNENLNVALSVISPEDLYKDAHRKILRVNNTEKNVSPEEIVGLSCGQAFSFCDEHCASCFIEESYITGKSASRETSLINLQKIYNIFCIFLIKGVNICVNERDY